MTIRTGVGNLLTQDVEALVNTVNGQGVMGKGIALQFKKAWPDMFLDYRAACRRGEVVPGRMHVWPTGQMSWPRLIINFPTKRSWRGPSRLADIDAGLTDLVQTIQTHGIRSIAVPPLGCGNGGLDWAVVEPRIRAALEGLHDVDVVLFAPSGPPSAADQPTNTPAPHLTPSRAALLSLIRQYEQATLEPPSLIAVQKLAYFLQNSGQRLRLEFTPHTYGPYADNLRKTLREMEGHFITGFGDGSAPVQRAEPLELLPDAVDAVAEALAADPDTQRRIEQVMDDIVGFESEYGLELLATVHWIVTHDDLARRDAHVAHEQVQRWNPRKSALFTELHVEAAWDAINRRHLASV